MNKFLAMGALVVCQLASVIMNGSYGLATGVIFMLVYVAYDLASFRLIDHSQNPELEEGYRVFSGSLAVVTILFAVWTATSMMAVASYKKEVTDNKTAIATAERLRDSALSSAEQSRDASKRKPNREAAYLREAAQFDANAAIQQAKIDKLQGQTPSDRNAVYEIIGTLFGTRIAKIVEGVMMLIGGALIPVLATSLFMLERRLGYKSMKTIEKPQVRSQSPKKTKQNETPDIRTHKHYNRIKQAILKQEMTKPSKKELLNYDVGAVTAGAMLKQFQKEGLVTMGNRGYEYVNKEMRVV